MVGPESSPGIQTLRLRGCSIRPLLSYVLAVLVRNVADIAQDGHIVPAELKRLWLCETGGSLTICTRAIIDGRRQIAPVRDIRNGALQFTRSKLQREY